MEAPEIRDCRVDFGIILINHSIGSAYQRELSTGKSPELVLWRVGHAPNRHRRRDCTSKQRRVDEACLTFLAEKSSGVYLVVVPGLLAGAPMGRSPLVATPCV